MFCASLLSDKETFLRGTLKCELVLFSNICSSGVGGLEFSHFLKSQSYHSKHSIKFIIRLPSESEVFKQTKRTGISLFFRNYINCQKKVISGGLLLLI